MSYAQFNLIEASDFNNLAGGNPTTSSTVLNSTWATGGGQIGYGQAAVGNVAAGQVVAATNWASLVNGIANSNAHQGGATLNLTAPTSGQIISYVANIPSGITTIFTNRGNAAAQGTTASNTQTTASAWTDYANFAFTVSFANGDAARYFFNAGGQIKLQCTHPNTTAGINAAMNTLATATGTVNISGQNSGTRTIAGTSYSGVTKTGGSGTATVSTNSGYFGLNTANTTIFDQDSGTEPYTTTVQIQYLARTSGPTVGGNSDNGNVVSINMLMDKVSGNGVIGSGSTCTCTVVPPSTTYLANSWGTITLAGGNTTA